MRAAGVTVLAVLGAGALALALAAFLQRGLVYFPTRASEADSLAAAGRAGLEPWRGAGGEILGWRKPAPGEARPVVVVLHGNAGTALDRLAYVRALAPRGIEVILLEYPGYGPRPGAPSVASLTGAAVAALDALAGEGRAVWLLGESIGSGVAARATAARPALVRGLLLVTPFADLTAVARHHYGAAAAALLRERYEPASDLATYGGPAAVLVAGRDEVLTPEEGRRLHAALPGPKRLVEQPAATHNTVDLSPAAAWWAEALPHVGLAPAGGAR